MREGRQMVISYRAMDGGLGQGDTEGAGLFNKFFSNLSKYSNLLLLLFSSPTQTGRVPVH